MKFQNSRNTPEAHTRQFIAFPPPPAAALHDNETATKWFADAVEAAGEGIPHPRPGTITRNSQDMTIFALAKQATPTPKDKILKTMATVHTLYYIHEPMRRVSDGARNVLGRLVAALYDKHAEAGDFTIRILNSTIATDCGKDERSVRRHLASLQEAGFIYRHYTTGDHGLRRQAIDLGPLVARLEELHAEQQARVERRAQLEQERALSLTMPNPPGKLNTELSTTKNAGGEDKFVPLITDPQNISERDTVMAQGKAVVVSAPNEPVMSAGASPNYGPKGRPEFTPEPKFVAKLCPTLKIYMRDSPETWPYIVETAYNLGMTWDLNKSTWNHLCTILGREWAAIVIATVAEIPEKQFTRSNAPTISLKRAAYVSGIVRRLRTGTDDSVAASWFRFVKSNQVKSEIRNRDYRLS